MLLINEGSDVSTAFDTHLPELRVHVFHIRDFLRRCSECSVLILQVDINTDSIQRESSDLVLCSPIQDLLLGIVTVTFTLLFIQQSPGTKEETSTGFRGGH
jgi:hypothetical protein